MEKRRTFHPRKSARKQRAADRFHIKPERRKDAGYMERKTTEAMALGLNALVVAGL